MPSCLGCYCLGGGVEVQVVCRGRKEGPWPGLDLVWGGAPQPPLASVEMPVWGTLGSAI